MNAPTLLLEADWVLPMDGPPIASGAVLIEGERIGAVGRASDLKACYGSAVCDAHVQSRSYPGCAILPGLINTHSHLDYSAFLGFSRPATFGRWMLRLLLARRRLTSEDYAVSARWGAEECLRNGVTCVADTSFDGSTAARAAREAGLRARVYLEVFGLDEGALPETMARTEARLAELQSFAGPLVDVGLSPHAPYTVSWRLFREVARYATRHGLHVATHVAESAAEVEFLEKGTGGIARAYRSARLMQGRRWTPPGLRPLAYLASAGALGPATLAVHCVHVGADEIGVLARTGTGVAHCPRSNAYLRCGTAPVAGMRAAGVKVGLGTDSLASNTSLDMFEEMRAALVAAQALQPTGAGAQEPSLTSADVLRMATCEAAGALGRADEIGSLETGKLADLVVLALPGGAPSATAGASPVEPSVHVAATGDLAGALGSGGDAESLERLIVAQACGGDVEATMVGGRVVFDRSEAPVPGVPAPPSPVDGVRMKLGLSALRPPSSRGDADGA